MVTAVKRLVNRLYKINLLTKSFNMQGPSEIYRRAMFYFLQLRRKCCLHSYISLYTNGDMFLVCI